MDSELVALLDRIMWGRRYATVHDGNGKPHTCIVKDLELQDRVWIDFIYKQALAEGKSKGLLSSGELAVFLEKSGVWTKKDEKEIQNLKRSIHKINEALEDPETTKRERQISEKMLAAAEKALYEKEVDRNKHFNMSAESFAASERVNAVIFSMLYSTERERYWKTWDDFREETDNIFIGNATTQVFKRADVTVAKLRKIARSSSWRFKWTAYKNSGDLFGKPLAELTQDQDALVYWSQVYDAAYESLDRPPEEVIQDDAALDKWFDEQAKQRKIKEAESGKGNVGKVGSSRVWKHSEVGIVVNPVAQADMERAKKMGLAKNTYVPTAEEVNEMNSPLSKKLLAHERKKLKKHGVLEERDLRSDPNSRRAISSNDVVFKKAKRKDGYTGKQVVDRKPGGTIQGRRG